MKGMITVLSILTIQGFITDMTIAGSMDSPGLSSAGSGMYSLSQIYNYLNSGVKATPIPGFQEPGAAPGPTMRTTKEIYDDIVAKLDQSDVTVANVESGKKFFCTQSGSWGIQTGTLVIPPTATPISSLYGGLVSYYKLDEISGTTAIDSYGSNYGTNSGATINQAGKIGKAYYFDGSNDSIAVPDAATLDMGTGDFSINVWVKIAAYMACGDGIVGKTIGDPPYTGFLLRLTTGEKAMVTLNNSSQGGTSDIVDNAWHMLTMVRTSGSTQLWVDASTQGNPVVGTYNLDTSSVMTIGNQPVWGCFLKGLIDELGIWNKALSSSEVSELWNNGSGKAL
ncbi:MAG: LamG domain-containing protein [Candidatus Aureabacteria bacterium]|nr:LamG domain-containing protein [Candidatus Auribacterota bacterium]